MFLTGKNFMTKRAVFVDTNVLVAAAANGAPFHVEAIEALNRVHALQEPAWISRQVIRELLATLSRPQVWGGSFDKNILGDHAERLLKLYKIAEEDAKANRILLGFVRDGRAQGKQVHDAAIASVMLSHGISRLLTLNMTHFERFKPEITMEVPGRGHG
jgi:predicted nucleic acid-binding protein